MEVIIWQILVQSSEEPFYCENCSTRHCAVFHKECIAFVSVFKTKIKKDLSRLFNTEPWGELWVVFKVFVNLNKTF